MSTMVKVANVSDVPPGSSKLVEANGQAIALFNVEGTYYAIDDACPHADGPLSEGDLDGYIVTCPWHGAQFDVTNGKVLCAPARVDVRSYPVTLDRDAVLIEVD